MGVFLKPASTDRRLSKMRESMRKLLIANAPHGDTAIEDVIAQEVKEVQAATGGALEPRWPVFIGAAILIVVLLLVTVYVAMAADAQAKDMTASQLKTLSTALITAFTGLSGAVIGMITGEAVSKKE